ncbi:Endonuclease [hydrothermal vent metagenome]|uniref:Endonuclease n=1 Tax=hydrothermal vent metagenome TaxID=652676 RepID=A0A3B1D988_9ZZZZ
MKNQTGKEGEVFAVKYLKKKGYSILASNYQTPIGEIDIVARDGDTIVFVEVKTRQSLLYGYPFEAVTWRKRERLKRLALYYLKVHSMLGASGRFDVIGLYLRDGTYQIQHIIDAFEV